MARATELGCRFRVTGNLVWLCDRDIPTDAIESIREWDDLESGPSQVVGAVGQGADTQGIWGPDEEEIARNREEGEQPTTERVAAAAKDLGDAMSSLQEGESVVMDASTWEVEIKKPSAASSSPGQPEVPSEEECDWSGEDTEVEVVIVEALPASSSAAGSGTKEEIEEGAEDKTEVLEDAAKRRKILRFGSAQIHILQAVAAADTANWVSLQQCIRQQQAATPAQQTAGGKQSRGFGGIGIPQEERPRRSRLGTGLPGRLRHRDGASGALQSCGAEVVAAPADEYQVGGRSCWGHRHLARERAARHRLAVRGPGSAGTLHDVPTEDHGTVLDMTMQDRAQEELREFRRELKAGGGEAKAPGPRPHQKDSERRKKLKRERYREKKRARRTHDDAERDQNHAIAHQGGIKGLGYDRRSEARIAPGFLSTVAGDSVGAALVLAFLWWMTKRVWAFGRSHTPLEGGRDRHVGGRRRKVRFQDLNAEQGTAPRLEAPPPFLGGPKTAKRLHPAEWEQEVLTLLLDRYAKTTSTVYRSQFRWWELFCLRRGVDPIRIVDGKTYDRGEEQLFLDFVVHSSTNEGKAPGTVKLRLAAVRSHHLTLGLLDPTLNMPRLPLAIAGIKRRYGTKERRKPVTPVMLRWIGQHLKFGRTAEASLMWSAICLGYFFLLRASEYLGVGYVDPNQGLRGCDVVLKENGKPCSLAQISITGVKPGTTSGQAKICVRCSRSSNCFDITLKDTAKGVQAPLFMLEGGEMLPRQAVTALLEQAAKALNMLPEGDFGTHSLRFGGASAIWASYNDSTMVKRWGRWSSDSFQTYIWDAIGRPPQAYPNA